jgi:integrase
MQKLTATAVKQAKSESKPYSIIDGGGFYLLVKSNGTKCWRYNYRFLGKQKTLSIGVYPEISLADARKHHELARIKLADNIDPSAHKKANKAAQKGALANSFEVIALEWLQKRGAKSEGGDKRLNRLLRKDLFPCIGKQPINAITAPELLKALRKIESRGAIDTAHRAKQIAAMIFRYAVATGRAERDPSTDLKGALAKPKKTHFSAVTEPSEVALLMIAVNSYQGSPTVVAALKLSPLLFCRPGELRYLEWKEVKLNEARIELSKEKMKMNKAHIIPLCTQAAEILEGLQLITGRGKYVFPGARGASRPLSENGVRTALRTMGFTNEQICPHGFRAIARTLLDEELHFPGDWIEHQLAHTVNDPNGGAYNRTKHLPMRHKMMQTWADYLDSLRTGNDQWLVEYIDSLESGTYNVIPFKLRVASA